MSKWEKVRLGDVLEYEQPTKYIVESTTYDDSFETPVLTAGQTFILGYTDETDNIYKDKLPCIIFDDFTTAIKYVDFPFKVKSSAMKILYAHENSADIKFLYYYMSTIKSDTGLHKRYWISKYSNLSIPLPPLDVQREIAATLDAVSDLLKLRMEQLKQLDLLVKSQFIEMFGDPATNPKHWQIGTIRDIVSEVRYGSSRPAVDGGKYPYLRMNNITYNGELDLTDIKWIDVPDEELPKCTVRRGDVLFNRTNSKELVGKTCLYNCDEMMVLAGFVIRVRMNEKALPEFLVQYLNLEYSKLTLLGVCKAAIGQANINAQELQNISIYIPPLELQRQFAEFRERVDKSKIEIQQAIDETQTLFDSLMQKYFG